MNMRWICGLMCVGLSGAVVAAQDKAPPSAMRSALSLIPDDAMLFICAANVKTLDADLKRAIADLDLTDSLSLPSGSLVAFLKQNAPFLEHADENASLSVFFMPASSLPEMSQKQVLMVTARDPQQLLDALQASPADDGTQSVTLFGQPLHVALRDKHLYFAATGELAKASASAKSGIDAKLTPQELAAISDMDVAVFVTDRFIKLAKVMVDAFAPMMMAQAQGGDAFSAKSAEMSMKNLNDLLGGMQSISIGIGLDRGGLTSRFGMRINPGSEIAKQYAVKNTDKPLLTGLPAGDYVLAWGGVVSREQAEAGYRSLEPLMALSDDVEGLDRDKVSALKQNLRDLLLMINGSHGVVEVLDPQKGCLVGVGLLLETSDGKRFVDLFGKLIDGGKSIVSGADEKLVSSDIKRRVNAISFQRDTAKAKDASVSVLSLDLENQDGIDEDDLEEIEAVLGKERFTIRFAPLASGQVAITFGGGQAYLERLIDTARAGGSPLAADKGIQLASSGLPKQRAAAYYLAVDHGLRLVQNILDALDEEQLPLPADAIDAPLALCVSGGDGWVRGDMYVPTPLMKAIAGMVRTMMGATAPQATPADSGGS